MNESSFKRTFAIIMLIGILFPLTFSCSGEKTEEQVQNQPDNPLFTLLDPEESGFDFTN